MNSTNSKYLRWQLPKPILKDSLPESVLSPPLLTLLHRRGRTSSNAINQFIYPDTLPDPKDHFPGLEKAINRLIMTCKNKEKVAICGDYDADGMTSTALLINALNKLNAIPIPFIPNRLNDGYGLNKKMVKDVQSEGINLIITVDNGVSAIDALTMAREYGIEVIVTDHHKLNADLPGDVALIHPDITPEGSPYRYLAGVGLAYIVASCLAKELNRINEIEDAIHLFTVGTIADMTPLIGANRLLTRMGLESMHRTSCEGLKAVQKIVGLKSEKLTSDDIGFKIAPRINAVGRISDPHKIIELLTETNLLKAIDLARECEELNRQRKELSDGIEAEAIALLDSDRNLIKPFILIAQNHWHQGVIGLVANKLVEKYNRPVALLAGTNNSLFRASVRAPKGFSVCSALDNCEEYLENHGGHPAAGGFTVKPENISSLHSKLSDIAEEWILSTGGIKILHPEVLLKFKQIDWKLWDEIQYLEPFGIGNQKPLFWSREVNIIGRKILRGGHQRLELSQDGISVNGIKWNDGNNIISSNIVDIAYHLSINQWNNSRRIQLDIQDIRPYTSELKILKNGRAYNCKIINETEIIITNANGREIKCSFYKGEININKECENHPYIKSLFDDAIVGLGLSI